MIPFRSGHYILLLTYIDTRIDIDTCLDVTFVPSGVPGINVKGSKGAGPPNGTPPRQHLGVTLSRVLLPALSLSLSLTVSLALAWLVKALANSITSKDSARVSHLASEALGACGSNRNGNGYVWRTDGHGSGMLVDVSVTVFD